MSSALIVTGGVTGGYTIEDRVLYSLHCITCGGEHPTTIECDPEKKAKNQAYWKRIADGCAKEFGWTSYW